MKTLIIILVILFSFLTLGIIFFPQPCGLTNVNGISIIECSCLGVTRSVNGYQGKWALNTIDLCYGYPRTKLCSSVPEGTTSINQYDQPVLCD